MTLAIVVVVVLGALAAVAGVVWAVRDVARYRIDVATRRELAKDAGATDARFETIDARLVQLERIAGGLTNRPVRR